MKFEFKKRNWIGEELKRPRGIRTVAKYNQFRIMNDSNVLTQEQIKELAQTYRPKTNQPELSVKTFLRNQQVQDYANNELMKRYVELGYTPAKIADMKAEIYQKSIKAEQFSTALKTAESIEKNLVPQIKVTETRQISQNNNLEANYNNALQEKQQVKIEVTQSNNDTGEDKKDAE